MNTDFLYFFGLIHGFGFGNYFEMLTDSLDAKITPLIGFALGVELSQLVIVLGILIINTIINKLNLVSRISYVKNNICNYNTSIFKFNISNDIVDDDN